MKRKSIIAELADVLTSDIAYRCPFTKKSPKKRKVFEVPRTAQAVLALAERIRAGAAKLKNPWLQSRKRALADALSDLAHQDVRAALNKSDDHLVEFYRGWVCTVTSCK